MKTRPCRCCDGSGRELDSKIIGAEMRALRLKGRLTLLQLGRRMAPRKLSVSYLSDLELGRRDWTPALVDNYRRICK